ncbi:MAG TPA: PhnD/SsuA/transferrin family substrate-binding protein [Candidatus Dormibacteraeota bacterium]|nr:PhnD/SsuA/transferrin family substrate-binding protein [Candidatus Dormibacteraeota bacterium]
MSDSPRTLLVGAVAYHPRVVTVWEAFRGYFGDRGLDVDYVLYSNYERLVDALIDGAVDLAWNTNTAYVSANERLNGEARILGMRDVDATYATVIVARPDDTISCAPELAGSTLALGSRDSGHAAILPIHFLAAEGVAMSRVELVRFDTDLGKHGDTGDSERLVVEAVAGGQARAGALGDATWAGLRADALPDAARLQIVWRSPTYCHCCFTARPDLDRERADRWLELLLAMSYDDPRMRHAMDLEGVKRWLPGDPAGYEALRTAMREQGYLS